MLHITYFEGQTAIEGPETGLAIFDNLEIKVSGIPLWHVRDLLTFFESDSKLAISKIDHWVRKWAKNSDEHL